MIIKLDAILNKAREFDESTGPTDATIVTTDVTTNNASTTKHGWFPKLPSPTGLFLKDDLTWAAAGGGGDFNVDGGAADTNYGEITAIDGGTA